MGVNIRILRTEMEKQSNVVFNKVKPIIQKKFNDAKDNLMEEFEAHAVTEAIREGADMKEGSLVSTAAGGNLYSLLGFEAGLDPAEDLKEILNENIVLYIQHTKKKITSQGITWETPMRLPTLEDINEKVNDETPLAWSPARSWVVLVEKGIPWFASYLFDDKRSFKDSRSEHAIEAKNEDGSLRKIRAGTFPKIKYVSELLANFKKSLFG